MNARKPPPVLGAVVSLTDRYGQARLVAHPVEIASPMEFVSPYRPDYGGDRVTDLADVEIGAYVGLNRTHDITSDPDRGVWGCGTVVRPHHVSTVEQAMSIARVLRRVTVGLGRLNASDGYLADDDFAGYLLRVAKVLRLTHIYVTQPLAVRERTGEIWRHVDGAGLQIWLAGVVEAVRHNRVREYVR